MAEEQKASPGTERPINDEVPREPEPSQSEAAASSPASSRGSAPSGPFVADAGPAFDPDGAEPGPELPPAVEEPTLEEILWDEEAVRRWLLVQGELTHNLIGVAEIDWRHTEADLLAISGPLSRILNRYEPTRAVAAYNDPLAVMFGASMYAIRSTKERRAVLAARAAEEEPITGVPAPPGSGPPEPSDLDWQKTP